MWKYLAAFVTAFALTISLIMAGCSCCTPPATVVFDLHPLPVPEAPCLDDEVVAPYVEVRLSDGGRCGAGTVISYVCCGHADVYVLTAGHVVDANKESEGDKHSMLVRKESEKGFDASREWIADIVKVSFDETHDLGLLKVRNPDGMKAARYTGKVGLGRGQDCWYIGTNGGLHGWLEKSIIARPQYETTREMWGKHTKPVCYVGVNGNGYYGNSGGGLFVLDSGHYRLVGVVVELARPNEKSPLLAVRQQEITEFLASYRD
jgi:hypothetical protein